ncbi:ABC-F family ATP-binding cassette domain-containing protein [Agromyces protaetiae]|uniref:ABC-F family ATP-binding cassette domain-containing protein n=1 Tax=Agromyces protaetiae TaxID=2509455 RepID=A0A4P6FFP8_9MICO|nr:ATP-binding cassette domain-containing protein [Agromyces protaetiae]QAY74726.1 ABC-F family ATP-binding cassette domain-containing protein [Agromyces protaetiae]
MPVQFHLSDHLRADGLSVAYGERRVFADLSFAVSPGERLGLIGENGVGKSTLLRLLAGGAQPEASGRLTRPSRVGLLLQEVPFAPTDRVGDIVEDALAEVRAIERELDAAAEGLAASTDAAAAAERYARALDAAERADVWSVDARRDEVLDGLGLASIGLGRLIGEVSGGQRSRFALAALLLRAPDALLLDEPTNHLDDGAAAFLEARLRAWRGPVVFASHDRAFLDRAATGLLDLDPARVVATRDAVAGATVFGGTFTEYLAAKADERARWERQYDDEQGELRRLRLAVAETARDVSHRRGPTDNDKYVTKFKHSRTDQAISRRVRNAEGRLETLEREQVRKPPAPLAFAGIPPGSHALDESSGLLAQLTDVSVDDRLAIGSLQLAPTARLLVTGANGAGKSTLLGVLAGRVAPTRGSVQRRKGLRVGLLEQDVRFEHPDVSPRALYERALGERRAEQVPLASLGLVAPRDADRPVGVLSVGQQRRLALALVIARPPHVFLLDEPTNHLSLGLATDLEDALGTYPGAVVIASHDRWLRARWAGGELRLEAGRVAEEVPALAG